jgi:MFS family permease
VQIARDTSRTQRSPEWGAGLATALERHGRVAYLDRLKLVLVALIIAGHGAVAYGDLENAWPYQDVQEVQLAAVSNVTLALVVLLGALFAMGLFFLMSGLVTPGSLARKGARRFARDRLIRLGVPLLVWTLLLWPGAIWTAHLAAGDTYSFWSQLRRQDPILDTGPMWFAEVLLIYSLAYAAWLSSRDRGVGEHASGALAARPRPISGRALAALAAGISVATVLVRLVFPAGSNQIGQAHLWQWPQFLAMFGLGTVAARRAGWTPCPTTSAVAAAAPRWPASSPSLLWQVRSRPPVPTATCCSKAAGTGPRSASRRSRARWPSARPCGCSRSPNATSTERPAHALVCWRAARTPPSCSKASS